MASYRSTFSFGSSYEFRSKPAIKVLTLLRFVIMFSLVSHLQRYPIAPPGKENMVTQPVLGSSPAAKDLTGSADFQWQLWWQTSPSPGKAGPLSSSTMRWRPFSMSLAMSCMSSVPR